MILSILFVHGTIRITRSSKAEVDNSVKNIGNGSLNSQNGDEGKDSGVVKTNEDKSMDVDTIQEIEIPTGQSAVDTAPAMGTTSTLIITPAVPELDENSSITEKTSNNLPIQKAKIKLNKIQKNNGSSDNTDADVDDDIQEVPVVKPPAVVVVIPDEDMGDTEVVSEDELPPPPDKEKVDGAEEVSDEELPAAPKPEIPPEAEDVSEDEEENSEEKKNDAEGKNKNQENEAIKDKIDDKQIKDSTSEKKSKSSSETNEENKNVEGGIASGKRKLEDVSDDSVKASDTQGTVKKLRDKSPEKNDEKYKKLPELMKYWKTVKDDPTDFTGWTYLLQYVDQENVIEAAEEAYSAFLAYYPYCYGYWRKYADYEKKKGTQAKCEKVFNDGLKAIPLSVDLWLHYLNYCKTAYVDNIEFIRKQFERSIQICGLEFRADRLWDNYIKWEIQQKEYGNVMKIYDRVFKVPLQGHNTHFENFQKFIETYSPKQYLSVDEFLQLRMEVLPSIKKSADSPMIGTAGNDDKPPGAEDDVLPGDDITTTVMDVDEANAIKEKIIALRRKAHKENALNVAERWSFEENIKRPYFHVKPLEKCQLRNWKQYLDFEIKKGIEERINVLFERCLIACALYEEFWYKYIKYLQEKTTNIEKIRDVFYRSCTIHHKKKVAIHFEWASFEEINGNLDKVREVYEKIEKEHPNLMEISLNRISFEKRHNFIENAEKLYQMYLNQWKMTQRRQYVDLTIKYARYCTKILKNVDKAVEILKDAINIEKDNTNLQDYTRLYFQLIDNALQRTEINPTEIIEYFNTMQSKPTINAQQKLIIVHRKLEFLEEFGKDIKQINDSIKEFRAIAEIVKKVNDFSQPPLPAGPPPPVKKEKKEEIHLPPPSSNSKKSKTDVPLQNQNFSHPPNQPGTFFTPAPVPPQFSNQYNGPPPQGQFPTVPPTAYQQYPPDPNNSNMYQQWYGQYGNYPQNWPQYPGSYPNGPPPGPHRF